MIANYGMENLRFIEPVKIGEHHSGVVDLQEEEDPQAAENAEDRAHGVVVWDVQKY